MTRAKRVYHRVPHPRSANASTKEPARLLAVHVADDGAQLTKFDNWFDNG
jgi:hypothetical protein